MMTFSRKRLVNVGVNRLVVYDRFWHESESLGAGKNFGGCPG